MPSEAIQVEGLREFQAAARRSVDSELPRRLGEAHKRIGALVIARLSPAPTPAAVGAGAGAAIRASASKRDVVLRAGGGHRTYAPRQIWGRQFVGQVGTPRPLRPYIRLTIDRQEDAIGQAYLEAISQAMSGAFAETKP